MSFFSGAADEGQHLAGANDGTVVHVGAAEHCLAAGINVQAIAEARADLADGEIGYGQLLAIETGRNGDERLVSGRAVEDAVEAAAGGDLFANRSGFFFHGLGLDISAA